MQCLGVEDGKKNTDETLGELEKANVISEANKIYLSHINKGTMAQLDMLGAIAAGMGVGAEQFAFEKILSGLDDPVNALSKAVSEKTGAENIEQARQNALNWSEEQYKELYNAFSAPSGGPPDPSKGGGALGPNAPQNVMVNRLINSLDGFVRSQTGGGQQSQMELMSQLIFSVDALTGKVGRLLDIKGIGQAGSSQTPASGGTGYQVKE